MMQVMAECWRVLRDDGICWVNLGDTYLSGKGQSGHGNAEMQQERYEAGESFSQPAAHVGGKKRTRPQDRTDLGVKPKSLALMPERFLIAAQSHGWVVRNKIIWHKPNPLPESVRDRCTQSYEFVYMLTKEPRYWSDFDAVREPLAESTVGRGPVDFGGAKGRAYEPAEDDPNFRNGKEQWGRTYDYTKSSAMGRNKRDVWTIATQPYSGAHFATWPEKLVEPMVKASTSEKGCCPECGAQWERVVDYEANYEKREAAHAPNSEPSKVDSTGWDWPKRDTIGWQPTCDHDHDPIQPVILDPFVGSGTTLKVARQLGRRAIGLDLSMEYLRLAQERNRQMTLWERSF